MSACVNIYQGTADNSWIPLDLNGSTAEPSFEIYIDQLYFMTTTTTTIGYGEFNAAKYPDFESGDNMLLISLLQVLAIFTFTLIRVKLFSL
jgi:hypothetical protein